MWELIQEVVRVEVNGQFVVLPLNFEQRLIEIEKLLINYFVSLEKKSVSFRVLSSLPTFTVLGLKYSQSHYRVTCRKTRKKDFYNIELIDLGITMKDINRDDMDLYELPFDMVHIPPISRRIQMFGVAPCCLMEEGVALNLRQKGDPNGVLSSNALEQIENFIGKSKCLQCSVEIIGVSRKDLSLVYGDIQIPDGQENKSLKTFMLDINAVLPNDFCESDIIRFSSAEGMRLLQAIRNFKSGLENNFEPCQNICVKGEIKPSLDAIWWLNIQKKKSEKKKTMTTKTLDCEVEYSNLGIKQSINQLRDDSRGRCPLLQTKSDPVNILGSGREKRLPRSASLPRHRASSLRANSSYFEDFSPPEPRSRSAIRSKEADLKRRLSSKRESRRVTFSENLVESFHSLESLRDSSPDLHYESVINQKEVKQSFAIRAAKLRDEVDKNKSKSVTSSAGYKTVSDISMDPYLSATKNFYDSNTDYSPSSPQSAHKGHLQKFESGNEQGIKSSPPCLSSGQADSCVTPASSPTLRSNANPSSKSIPFGRKQFLESRKSKNFNEQGLKSKRPSLSSEQADDQIRTASCPTSEGVNLSKKQNTFRILVEGKGKPPRRNHLSEYHFDDRLMRFLSFNKREVVLMSEAYIWPAIQELRDTLIVQKVQTVYMIPLLNNLLSNDFPDDPLAIGPRNLIICASWEDCHQLGIEISKVLGQHKNELKYCCDLYGAFNDTSNVAKYTKRFDILVATLPAFMRLLDQHESNFTFSLDRCSAIVFENLDSLLRLHPDALARLLHYYSVSKKSKPEILRQVIACTTKWNNNVRVFKEESMESPLLFFPNMIEGALYAGVKFKISVAINKSKEKEELLKIMSNQPHDSRVVIFTKQGPDVVDDLVNFLAYNDFAVEGVYRLMKQGLLNDVQYKWNNAVQLNKGIVIVCSDDIWSDLAISNAHRTIHFDINEHSRLDFSRRMAASLDYYTTDKDTGLLPSPVPIHSHIILSESGGFNILSDMLKVVERSGTSIPNELSVLSNKIRLIKEKVKTEQLLCHTLKMFGECRDIGQCSQRHYVQKESDVPIGVSHGELIVRVTCVPEANVFNGVITKIINPDGIEKENTELSKLEKDMLEYFNGPNGRMSVGQSCKVNSLYAFENEKSFMRVKVLEILKKEERLGKPLRVAVKFIDTGRKAELDTYELLELPDHFHSIPKQALEFICCGVKPSDMDRSFDIRVKHVMEKKLLGSLIHGRIKLALGETIWLSPAIRLMIRSGKHCLGLSAKQMLIKENLAEENSDHLENLYKLCKEGGLALPDYTHTVTHKRTQQAYRDFLNREDYTIVFISFIVNPNKFFVTRTDKSQFLENLEQELQNSVLIPLKRVYNGLYCLAKFFQDGNLYRAQAVGEEEKGKVNVFFVDHGETESVPLSDLFEIDDWMLKKLPLQAIQCKLAGIEPVDGNEYSQEASNYFWDLTRDKDFMLEFSAIVLDKKENIYDVALFQENAELSESLVQKNHANRLFFTNVVLRSEESDESETDEFETCNWQHFYDMLNYKPEKRKYLTKRKELQSGASTASASASKLEGKKKSSFTIYASVDESDSEKDCLLRDPRYDRLLPISDPDSSSSEESDFALSDDENRIPTSRKTFDF